ncbi:hypothetical protein LTR81_019229, partial [Elasticomyces elasticus]
TFALAPPFHPLNRITNLTNSRIAGRLPKLLINGYPHTRRYNSILSDIQGLLFGLPTKQHPKESPPVGWHPRLIRYVEWEGPPPERWDKSLTPQKGARDAEAGVVLRAKRVAGATQIVFEKEHRESLSPSVSSRVFAQLDFINHAKMKSWVQVLTTPTADTPGTTLILHFDNKRYLIGSLAEGTQRACIQMGARLLKVNEIFITGRTEWRNTGGLMGMILTLADAASSSAAASAEDSKKRALAKGKRLGCIDDVEKMQQLEDEAKREMSSKLNLFSAPNLNYTLATARRFVFRKGMPVSVLEIEAGESQKEGEQDWTPYWADENVKVWAISVLPKSEEASSMPATAVTGRLRPRKRTIDEVYERGEHKMNGNAVSVDTDLTPAERDRLTVKAVVGEMFDSSWRLDALHETPLSQIKLPATMFVRNTDTNKLERYHGPLPGQPLRTGQQPADPNMTVLVRKPWPGALVESLPPTKPRKEALSYIIRNHTQRGKFHPERAVQLKVEKGFKWSQLSSGNSVENQDGETITPDMVLGESKEGGGLAVVDLPDVDYIEPLLARAEWHEQKVMAGVGAFVWICGPGVADDTRLRDFMAEFKHLEHIISSPDYCPNNIALDSAAAATARLRQVDPARYVVPIHQNEPRASTSTLPEGVRVARRGQTIQLEPKVEVQEKDAIAQLNVAQTESETSKEVLQLAAEAQTSIQTASDEAQKWASSLPHGATDAEIVTLGTGSALPSKYRNVSATLLRVPGWGSMLFDAGENTLGQLKRVFPPDELKQVLRELRLIWISHMHADHHLGTVGVIRAWYEEVHGARPLPADADPKTSFDTNNSLAVVSEPAMMSWLAEYRGVEDYGYSRIAPLHLSVAVHARGAKSRLNWFVSPAALAEQGTQGARADMLANNTVLPNFLNLQDIQCVAVKHCHGARAVSITFPSGFKASYSGDCRPSHDFSRIGKGSTVCIHEATFDDELQGDAEAKNHSTTSEALGIAQKMSAKACVLTHFSQRYQKLPIMEHGAGGSDRNGAAAGTETAEAEEESADPEDGLEGPLEDAAASLPDQPSAESASKGPDGTITRSGSGVEAVRFKLDSDMKVCVAFDYMRVKVGEIPQMEKFTPALLKLFEEEEKPTEVEPVEGKKAGKSKKRRNN